MNTEKTTAPTIFIDSEVFIKSYSVINGSAPLKKTVIITAEAARFVTLTDGKGSRYTECGNLCEPFDFTTHVFYLSEETLSSTLTLNFKNLFKSKIFSESMMSVELELKKERLCRLEISELLEKYDNKLEIVSEKKTEIAEGISYRQLSCKRRDTSPVAAYVFEAKNGAYRLDVGTANNGFLPNTAIDSVENQAISSLMAGKNIIGATNADFYDFHGDNSPSGLCVKDGVTIANPNSERNFVGFTFDGKAVIGSFAENPELRDKLWSAVGGREIFLRGGKICDFSPAEPFAYVSHPRTSVGITSDGDLIILVVDGRMPVHSNGATVVDLARLMQKLGADTAINLDGGGSSTFLVRNGDRFYTLNQPVDLNRPGEVEIRRIYNSIQLVTN